MVIVNFFFIIQYNRAGLWIRSSGFWAIRSFFVSKRTKERFACWKELIAPVALLSWATWVNFSRSLFCHERPEHIAHGSSFVTSGGSESLKSLFKKEKMSKDRRERFTLGHKKGKNCQKHTKIRIFRANRSFFANNPLKSRANQSHRSFVRSNVVESLTVALLLWAMWANCSVTL